VIEALERPDLVALCDVAQYRLFVSGAGDQRAIRFAPAFVRPAAEQTDWAGDRDAEDVEWVHSGRYAGVVRLHPVLHGAVHTMQRHADDDGPDELNRGQW